MATLSAIRWNLGHRQTLQKSGRTGASEEGRARRVHATPPRHPQCHPADEDPMAMRVNDGVKPIKSRAGMDRGGSRPQPPKAVAQRASLEAARSMPDHEKSKRPLTDKTVAFSADC
jgi:hypothetical protein